MRREITVKKSIQFKPTCFVWCWPARTLFLFRTYFCQYVNKKNKKWTKKLWARHKLAKDLHCRKLIWHRKKEKKEGRKKKKTAQRNCLQTDNGTICLDKMKMLCQQRETERWKEKRKEKKEGGRKQRKKRGRKKEKKEEKNKKEERGKEKRHGMASFE